MWLFFFSSSSSFAVFSAQKAKIMCLQEKCRRKREVCLLKIKCYLSKLEMFHIVESHYPLNSRYTQDFVLCLIHRVVFLIHFDFVPWTRSFREKIQGVKEIDSSFSQHVNLNQKMCPLQGMVTIVSILLMHY